MNFQPADSLSLALFCIFGVLMFAIILFAFKKAQLAKKFYILFVAYIFTMSALVYSGLVREHVLPAVPLLFASLMILAVSFAFSSAGEKIAQHFSLAALLGFQCFRLPLELILHHWADIGTIPSTMTWTGQNLDILTGIVSLVTIPWLNRSRALAWIVQIVGFVLLMNVIRVVIMSSPFPFSWNLENPLQLALYFPYVLIAPLFVAPALFTHLVVFRKISRSLVPNSS